MSEKEQLKQLGIIFLTIIGSWLLIVKGQVGHLFVGGDAWSYFPRLHEIIETYNGDWTKVFYRSDILGGIRVSDAASKPFTFRLFGLLGLSTTQAMNLNAVIVQTIFSFLCIQIVLNIQAITKKLEQEKPLHWVLVVAFTWIVGFAPYMGKRLAAGHTDVICGLFMVLLVMNTILFMQRNKITYTSFAVLFISFSLCFTTYGMQFVLYSLVFGVPIFVGLILLEKESFLKGKEIFFLIFALSLSALFIAMPSFYGFLDNASSGDSPRTITGRSIIYDFWPSQLSHWLYTLFWPNYVERFGDRWPVFVYPFGALALIPFAFGVRCLRKLRWALVISLVFVFCFIFNFYPVSESLQFIVPIIKKFRIAQRSILVVFPFISILVILTVQKILKRGKIFDLVYTVPIIVGLFFIQDVVREVIVFVFCILLLIPLVRRKLSKFLTVYSVLFLFGVFNLFSFYDFTKNTANVEATHISLRKIGDGIKAKKSIVKEPFTRTHINFKAKHFFINSGISLGIPSFQGYWIPTARFSKLQYALMESRYVPANVSFYLTGENNNYYEVNRHLYNVCCSLSLDKNNQFLFKENKNATLGPAWINNSLAVSDNFYSLKNYLFANIKDLPAVLKDKSVIMKNDLSRELKTFSVDKSCKSSQVSSIKTFKAGQEVQIYLNNMRSCPITISTNYISTMQAMGLRGDERLALTVFPSYGTLTGILVPEGVTQINLSIEPKKVSWPGILMWAGFLLLAISICWLYKLRRRELRR